MVVVSTLLIVTQSQIKVDPNAISDADLKIVRSALGDGDYTATPVNTADTAANDTEWAALGLSGAIPSEISRVIAKDGANSNIIAFEVTTDGYAQDGVKLLICADTKTKKVTDIKVLALGETPGLGTNIEKNNWLGKFVGAGAVMIQKGKSDDPTKGEYSAVTGATRSSEGVFKAVNAVVCAINGAHTTDMGEHKPDMSGTHGDDSADNADSTDSTDSGDVCH
jgi:electron transport complex protein RnfG